MTAEPVAIVGMSCRLPGGANDLKSLWDLLANGVEAWSMVPADRFNEAAFHHPNADDPNGTNNHRGGHFIDGDIRDFDHAFFHLSRQQAAAMDPQQRILLEMAYEALESAGLSREAVGGSRTAVYAAIFGMDYERNLVQDVLDLPIYQSVGTGTAILANRISHVFDLRGPSVTLDTGCSGGLVALHHAFQSLRNGETDAALVASANLQLMPDQYIGMSNQHMVSSSGRCYPFDARGDGYGRGEGFAVVVLKRLSDALRNRDPVRSIIINTGMNQDGYTASGITHPSRSAQADLIRETYARARLRPQDALYVEAHGTGTVAGDSEELAAIDEVFGGPGRSLPLFVGSNKGNIGHTESTSGLASLLKAISMLEHGEIPPVAGFASPKPGLPLERICIPTQRMPWPKVAEGPRRISINSFGYGGANAHAILEQGSQTLRRLQHDKSTTDFHIIVLSANSQSSLNMTLKSHLQWIDQNRAKPLADISYTLCQRRSALPWRFSCTAASASLILDALQQGIRTPPKKPAPLKQGTIFVFTGQGAQWLGMGRELLLDAAHNSKFRESILASRDILRELGATWDLEVELLRSDGSSDINMAELAQPATTAVQIALVQLLLAFGVRPSAVVGHSSGEIAAAYAAGRLSHPTAICVSFHRGFMMAASKSRGLPPGGMLSLGLGEHDAAPLVNNLSHGRAVVACVNSPSNVTVSGDATAVDEVLERVKARGDDTFCRKLLVDTAYHSHHMQAVAAEYRARLGELELTQESVSSGAQGHHQSDVSMFSSVTGQALSSDLGTSYWIENLVSPVRFSDAIQTATRTHPRLAGGHALFVEIGPHPALAGPVRQCLADTEVPKLEYEYLSVLRRGVNAVFSVLELAGRVFEHGVKVNFKEVLTLTSGADTAIVQRDLPSYSWDRSVKHWHESRLNRQYRMRTEAYHDLLGVRMIESSQPRWRHMVGVTTLPWLADHVIDGLTIFPGAGYVCMAFEAVNQLAAEQKPNQTLKALAFRDITFLRALVVPEPSQRVELQLSLEHRPGAPISEFYFCVTALVEGEWHEHCTGYVEGISSQKGELAEGQDATSQQCSPNGTVMNVAELYTEMAANGNTYGPAFQGLRSLNMAADGTKSAAVIQVPDIAAIMPAQHQARHTLHPSTFDSMFHVGIPMIRHFHGAGSVMPVHIGEMLISTQIPALKDPGSELHVLAEATSSHFRTTSIDMFVTDGHGKSIMHATEIESRSLGAYTWEADSTADAQGICYELSWQSDLDFLLIGDLPAKPSLADLVAILCWKAANLSVIELAAGHGHLASIFLASVSVYGGTLETYDLTDTTTTFFDEARKNVFGRSLRFRILDEQRSLEAQCFTPHAYDVVLASDLRSIIHWPSLLRKNGLLILVLKSEADFYETWNTKLQQTCPNFKIQLSFADVTRDVFVVVVRDLSTSTAPCLNSVRLVTHSAIKETPGWIVELQTRLTENGVHVIRESLSQFSAKSESQAGTCIMIIDDLPLPILSDQDCFDDSISMLRQKHEILWVSLDGPPSMHQITGVGRTAHAENNDLRLITAHVAQEALENPRLAGMIFKWLSRVADRAGTSHHEREYRMDQHGTVLIPRLRHSSRLNNAITSPQHDRLYDMEIEERRFADTARPVYLQIDDSSQSNRTHTLFTERHQQARDLGGDEIEIETQVFVLSEAGKSNPQAPSVGNYAGIVRKVGKNITGLATGDAVVAISPDGNTGANTLRIPASHACKQPDDLVDQPGVVAALFLPTLAATYALFNLCHLQSNCGTVLIHCALSHLGRATVAVARALGVNVTATAADAQEAMAITEQLGILPENVIGHRKSLLHLKKKGTFRLDAIIHTGVSQHGVPRFVWAWLKAFGHLVTFPERSSTSIIGTTLMGARLPRNAVIHVCHFSDVLHEQPKQITGLVAHAARAIEKLPMLVRGLDLAIYDVSQISEALRLLRRGIVTKVALYTESNSLVSVAIPPQVDDSWAEENATYVVAGGMGDLGRRLLVLMARRGAAHLVTLSRREIDSEDFRAFQSQLEDIRSGCRLHCLRCDVTEASSLQDAAAALAVLGLPPVRGVIQSAVFLQDRTLERMRFKDFNPVTLAKIEGTLALERYLASPHLDFFLMLSSAVVITGASGQANYNAGNAVQDALAHTRVPGFMSLNIGWIEDAIHTSKDKTRLQGLWRTGLRPILPHELERYLDYALGAASARSKMRQAVIGFNVESLSHTSAGNGNVHSALFCHVRGFPATGSTSSSAAAAMSFQKTLESGNPDSVVDFISRAITERLTILLSADAAQAEAHGESILDLGLDSLVAIELRNWITREFDAPLQSSELMKDQPIRALAQRVASRSLKISPRSRTDTDHESVTTTESSTMETPTKLPQLPLPQLQDVLRIFEESRIAIDTEENRRETSDAVKALLDGPGPELYHLVETAGLDELADAYERQVYLMRREPIPETGPFTFIHPLDLPSHSQPKRAAILTVAALDFARRLAQGRIAPDTLHGEPLTAEGREWLFYATRRPGLGVDSMERHTPNHVVAVMRRGHVFQLTLPDRGQLQSLSAVHQAYDHILKLSEDSSPSVCTLTADGRNSWAQVRTPTI